MKAAWLAPLLMMILALSGCTGLQRAVPSTVPASANAPAQFAALVQAGAPLRVSGLEAAGLTTLVARAGRRDGVSRWLGPSGAGLYFRDGLLVATRGLGAGLLAADVSETARLVRRGQAGRAQRFHTYLTGDNQRVTRTYHCLITSQGVEPIVLGDGQATRQALRMQEDCTGLDEQFQNQFWVTSGGGTILRSRQWTGPHIGMVSFVEVPIGTDLQTVLGGLR